MHNDAVSVLLRKFRDQRCMLLFLALVLLLVALPFLSETQSGQMLLILVNVSVLLTAIAAVGRTWLSLLVAGMLVLPALVFRLLSLRSGHTDYLALTWGFNALFYLFIMANLFRYVFRLDLMSRDKLYGAVAAYILIAIFWAQLHALIQHFYPGAYTIGGIPQALDIADLIYFSFAALSTAGFGDIAPALMQSRYLTILEMIVGVMFVAILIARLTGVYPLVDRRSEPGKP